MVFLPILMAAARALDTTVGTGWAHMQFGDYQYAILTAAVAALIAAGLSLMIGPAGRTNVQTQSVTPAASTVVSAPT